MAFFIDTHCHLDAAEFDTDRDAVYAAAIAAGVDTLVIPAVSRDDFAAVAATCARYPGCLPAWGLHPMTIHMHRPEHLADLSAQIETQRPVAVGEIGLEPDAILHAAGEYGVDVIAVGDHDRNWFSKLVSPSVSEAITDRADVRVLMIRVPKH